MQQGRTPSGSGEVTLGKAVLQVLTLQPVPVNGGKAVAEAVFGVEERRIEQQAAQQQQDRLLCDRRRVGRRGVVLAGK
mgnify:CR=1 FL=1